jgi:hypothetical protein
VDQDQLALRMIGLFVDGHSLLDFFSFVGFLDAESIANSFHNSNKFSFQSMLETRVAASMQNYFPAPFQEDGR